jgi:hypothetical protein
MTQRERTLTQVLLAAMLLLGGGMLCHVFVWQPLSEVRERLANEEIEWSKTSTDLLIQKRQTDAILRLRPRLKDWHKTSLPPRDPELAKKKRELSPEEVKKRHVSNLQIDYERFLSELLRRNGFPADSIRITPRQTDSRNVPMLPGKVPLYETLTFTVAGRAKLDGVVQMLQDFHRTPLLHSVRNLSLTLPETRQIGTRGRSSSTPTDLNVAMTVEALIVRGAEQRSALMPTVPATTRLRVLAEPMRRYVDMNGRNMFTGVARSQAQARATEQRNEVLRFVKLTTLAHNGRRWEAYLYDQAKGGGETRVNNVTVTEFSVRDRYENSVLDGEVVHIDAVQMVFRSAGKFYKLRLGDFLFPAIDKPLTTAELKELGLAATTA